MKRALMVAVVALACPNMVAAACKYKAADGSWTYSHSCARMSEKEIDQSAAMVLKKNQQQRTPDSGLEGVRLKGFEYSDTTHSGMRIRMVEPNKAPPKQNTTTQ